MCQFLNYVTADTVFTVTITLFVFIVGISINEGIKFCERRGERKRVKKYFKYQIDKLADSYSVKLIQAYIDFYKSITIDTGVPMTPPKIFSGDFERIRNIESKELFQSISEKKELSNILNQIDYFDNIVVEVADYHKSALVTSDIFREKIDDQIKQYMNLLSEFTEFERKNNPNYKKDPHFIMFNESIVYFYNDIAGKRALQEFYEKVLRPNQEYLVKEQLFRSHEKGKDLAELGKNLSYCYNDLLRWTVEYIDQFKVFAQYLEESRKLLIENKDKINWG